MDEDADFEDKPVIDDSIHSHCDGITRKYLQRCELVSISSIKHDLGRSCFQFWLKIGDEGDKISRKKLARR